MKIKFRNIINRRPCKSGWAKLCNNVLGAGFPENPESWRECQLTDEQLDAEISLSMILESNGINDALWSLGCLDYRDECLFRADVAESVIHIWESKYNDDRPRKVIEAIRLWHSGKMPGEQLDDMADAVYVSAAAYSVYVADAAAAAYAAAATDAETTAAYSVYAAAAYAASADADAAAKRNQWKKIEVLFIKHFGGGER